MKKLAILGLLQIGLLAAPAALAASDRAFSPEQIEFFEKKVRPILADNCYSCHGPKVQQSGLRLDHHEAVLKGGDSGPALIAGKPDESELIAAVRYESFEMPPKGQLPQEQIDTLASWVRMGAPWPKSSKPLDAEQAGGHWAFQPIKNAQPPSVDSDWVQTPIDQFIVAKLNEAELTPSPKVDRRTLIRRATLDLIGIPPTPKEVNEFLADKSPNAFEKVIDRLLGSPQYGERWGRYWLDVARYADTKGYVFTEERRYPYSYTYRDYVVKAFNDDLPIDQFITEQLAADLMADGRGKEALAGLGYLTVGRRFRNNTHEIIDDRIDVTTRGLMGLTVTCARCHDHKFDPIPAADYYSLYGVFASCEEPKDLPELPSTAPEAVQQEFAAKKQSILDGINKYLGEKQQEYNEIFKTRFDAFLAAAFEMNFNPRHPKAGKLAEGLKVDRRLLGLFVEQWKTHAQPRVKLDDPVLGVWQAFAQIPEKQFPQKAGELVSQLQAENSGNVHPLVLQMVLASPPASMKDVVKRYGQAFLAAQSEEGEDEAKSLIDAVCLLPTERVSSGFNRAERDVLRRKDADLERLKATHAGAPPRAMVLSDRQNPYNPYVFLRGTPGRRGPNVPRQFLAVLTEGERKPFSNGSGRLELAQHIVSNENPLTARVFVNRVWLNHFGFGLVRTPSDFGLQGEAPTHPELLDYLAWGFREEGWSLKRLHKRIMLSAVYQQESVSRPEGTKVDPENRLLWKFNIRRLDFEGMRDSLLAVAGKLNNELGGRAVSITEEPYSNRRTLYGFIDRQNLDGLYRTFDFASPNASSPQRFVTTVPQQALFLMNGTFVVDQASALAKRTAQGDLETRIRDLYQTLFARLPEENELALGKAFIEQREQATAIQPGWSYGLGDFDAEAKRLKTFETLNVFKDNRWLYGQEYPDPKVGHLSIGAGIGHPGKWNNQSAVLRWTSPCNGVVDVDGRLRHKHENGDGIVAFVLSHRTGVIGEWAAHNKGVRTSVDQIPVERGEVLDFVVIPQKTNAFDSYDWNPTLKIQTDEAVAKKTWDAKADFHGPLRPQPSPWQVYVQTLLMSNEFAFVD